MLYGKIFRLLFLMWSSNLLSTCKSARILSIIPYPMRSHDIVYKPLLVELARRGHSVTAIGPYASTINDKNYKEIVFETKNKDFLKNCDFYEMRRSTTIWNMGWTDLFQFWDANDNTVEDIYSNPQVDKLIKAKNETFDLIICEGFFGFESLFVFGRLYKAPVIAVSSLGSIVYINQHIGNPIATSYYPNFLLPYSDKMTLFQRLHNLLMNLFIITCNELFHIPKQEKLIQKYFGGMISPMPPLKEMLADVSMVFLNAHVVLGFPRPNLPNVIDVGGLHIQPTTNNTEVDKDLQELMDKATQGVIYFSFGSNINLSKMPESYTKAFLESFSKIPLLVLWKWGESNRSFLGKTKNIHISPWYPQQQILAHKNCKVFITHGGLLSLEEAAYNAVPVIGLPFFGDQPMNMKRVEQISFGISLEYDNITTKSVSWALNEITTNREYEINAKKISSIFRDEYGNGSALERAAYWVEYVLRYDGAPHLRTTARLLPWYKYLMLDAVCVLLLFIFISVYAFHLIFKLCIDTTFSKNTKIKNISVREKME
ncbi:UDP-glycosyltransferase UGT5-like isoform X2 [Lycorma delicatula]|uniref:UDP-glycosyltransferase UGT5-like isoform X2 n=1 Tax=Lycorma delicatula TaxID=130591 RepID=UPI003F50EBC1